MSSPFQADIDDLRKDSLDKRNELSKSRIQRNALGDDPDKRAADVALAKEGGVHPYVPTDPDAQDILRGTIRNKKHEAFVAEPINRNVADWLVKDGNAEIAHDQTDGLASLAKIQHQSSIPGRERAPDFGQAAKGAKRFYAGLGRYFEDIKDRATMGFVNRDLHDTSANEVLSMAGFVSSPDEIDLNERPFLRARSARLAQETEEFDSGIAGVPLLIAEQFGNMVVPLVKQLTVEAAITGGVKAIGTVGGQFAKRRIAPIVFAVEVTNRFKTPVRRLAGQMVVFHDAMIQEMGGMAEESRAVIPPTKDFPMDHPDRLTLIILGGVMAGSAEMVGQLGVRKPLTRGALSVDKAMRSQFRKALTEQANGGFVRQVTRASAGEALTEGFQESVAVVMIEWQKVLAGASTFDEAVEAMFSPETRARIWTSMKAGATVGGTMNAMGHGVENLTAAMADSIERSSSEANAQKTPEQTVEFLEQLDGVMNELAGFKERDPSAQIEAINASGANGGIQTVKMPAQALNILHQEGEIDIEEVFNSIPEGPKREQARAEYQRGIEDGGDVEISIGDYAVNILQTELNEKLVPHIRLRESDYTQTEAAEVSDEIQKEAEAASERAAEIIDTETEREKKVTFIQADLARQIQAAAPQFKTRDVGAQAKVVAESIVNLSERAGMTVEDVRDIVGPITLQSFTGRPGIIDSTRTVLQVDGAEGDVVELAGFRAGRDAESLDLLQRQVGALRELRRVDEELDRLEFEAERGNLDDDSAEFNALFDPLHDRSQELRQFLQEMGVEDPGELVSKSGVGEEAEAVLRVLSNEDREKSLGLRVAEETEEELADARRTIKPDLVTGGRNLVETVEAFEARLSEQENVLFQPEEEGGEAAAPRGFFAETPDGAENFIGLGQNANLSTFLHEAVGHYLVNVLGQLSQSEKAPQQMRDDYAALLKFAGVEDGQEIVDVAALSAAIDDRNTAIKAGNTEAQVEADQRINDLNEPLEIIARASERYLRTGIAPSVGLRGAFDRIQQWMRDIYENVTRLLVRDLPEDVITAFDRLIASDSAIARAKSEYNLVELFQKKPEGMTDAEWDQYRERVRKHDVQARALLLQRQRKIEERRQREQFSESREDLERLTESGLKREPLQQAREWLGTGRWIGRLDERPPIEPSKLDHKALVAEFGERILRELPTGRRGVVSGKRAGGQPHWEVARMFGLTPEQLIEGLKTTPLLDTAVRESVKEQQAELEMTFEELTDAALQSLHEAGAEVVVGDMAWARGMRDQAVTERIAASQVAEGPAGTPAERRADTEQATDELSEAKAALEAARETGVEDVIVEAGQRVAEATNALEIAAQRGRAAAPARRAERAALRGLKNIKLLQKALRAKAEADIASRPLGNLKPDRHSSAERRAVNRANKAVATKDFDALLEAKADQLYHHFAFRAVVKALERKRAIQGRIRRITKPKHLDKVRVGGAELADHVLALAINAGLINTTRPVPELERDIVEMSTHMSEQDGISVIFDPAFVNRTIRNKAGWRDMSLVELEEISLAIVTLDHIGFEGQKVFVNGKRQSIDDYVDLVVSNSREKYGIPEVDIPIDPSGPPVPLTKFADSQFKDGVKKLHSYMMKIESFARYLDFGAIGGPAWQFFGKLPREAQALEHRIKRDFGTDINKIFGVYSRSESRRISTDFVWIPSMQRSLTVEKMMMVALNAGNAYQREAMMKGFAIMPPYRQAMTEPQLQDILRELEKDSRHLKTVEAIWDMLDARWPMIRDHQQSITGVAPNKVETDQFTLTSGRVLKGGYIPLKKDSKYSTSAQRQEDSLDVKQQFGGQSVADQTRHGFTKGRKNFGKNAVLLDFNVLYRHMNEVAHDTAQREFVIDALRVIRHPKFERMIEDITGREMLGMMEDWVRNIAGDVLSPLDSYSEFFKQARIGANSSIIGFSLTTIAVQPLALTNTMVKVGVMPALRAVGQFILHPGLSMEYANNNSLEVPFRMRVRDREVAETISRLKRDGGITDRATELGYLWVGRIDLITAAISFQAGVNHGMNTLGMTEDQAIEYSDSLIPQTQGSGAPKDLSRLQSRPSEFVKQATVFFTYWSAVYDLNETLLRDTIQFKTLSKTRYLNIMFWWMVVIPALSELILGRHPDVPPADDPEEWLKFVGWAATGNLLNMVPIGGAIARSVKDSRELSIGTSTGIVEEAARGTLGAASTLLAGEPEEAALEFIEHTGKAIWMYKGIPGLVQGERLIKTVEEIHDGNNVSPRLPMFGRNR